MSRTFAVGDWVVEPDSNLVRKGDETVRLEPRAVDVLSYLADHPDTVISTQALIAEVWGGRLVEDGAVYQSIAKLRSALDDRSGKLIETVPRRGYRLNVAHRVTQQRASRPKSIAVATFTDLDETPDSQSFSSALHTTVVRRLLAENLDCLVRKTAAIQSENDDYLLEGDVHVKDDRANVNVSLIRCADGVHLYADSFSEPVEPNLDEVIAGHIVGALAVHLDEARGSAMQKAGTGNAEAYAEYLAGVQTAPAHQIVSPDTSRAMLEHFQNAVRHDPSFVEARMGIAQRARALIQYSSDESLSTHRRLITEQFNAVQTLNATSAQLQEMSMLVAAVMHPELHSLEERLRMQLLEGTAIPDVYVDYGRILLGGRLFQEAIDYIDAYMENDPDSSASEYKLAAYTGLGDLEEAAQRFERSLEKSPDVVTNRTGLIQVLAALGEVRKANAYLRQLRDIDSDGIWYHSAELALQAVRGDIKTHDLDAVLVADDEFNYTNGIVSFIVGDIDRGCRHWRNLNQRDMDIAFYWPPHAEIMFPEGTIEHPRYQMMLDELGIGRTWQNALADRVTELTPITGIVLRSRGTATVTRLPAS